MLKVGIIGAGLIGKKRAEALLKEKSRLTAVSDIDPKRAQELASAHGAEAMTDSFGLIAREDVDLVIVATTNEMLTPLAKAALECGKHALIEKPGARTPQEMETLRQAEQSSKGILKVGFNHRFHPGLQKAKEWMSRDGFGELMMIRARYGHGARVGYEKEWRADVSRSGGGELLDQGVHLIDLCRWLGGEWSLDYGYADTFFWDMPVEDNGFLVLKANEPRKRVAFLHASCSEWKNLFDLEIYGTTAKIQVSGLGRSYGTEEVKYFQMLPEMGPPTLETESFPGEDQSWKLEFQAFLDEIEGKKTDIAHSFDALRSMQIVYEAYRQSGLDWAK